MKQKTISFIEILEAYDEHGLSVFAKPLTEEPTEEEFNKELEKAKAKAEGKGPKAEVAKAAVKAVKMEEVEDDGQIEQLDELSKDTLTSYKKKSISNYKELVDKALKSKSTNGDYEKNRRKAGNRIAGSFDAAERLAKMKNEQVDQIEERTLSDDETNTKEKYVKSMKSKMGDFKKRYGKNAKSVMYATATKMAKEKND